MEFQDKNVKVIKCPRCKGLKVFLDLGNGEVLESDDCNICGGTGKMTIIRSLEVRPYKRGDENE